MEASTAALSSHHLAVLLVASAIVCAGVFLGVQYLWNRTGGRGPTSQTYERRMAVYSALGEIVAVVAIRGRLTAQEKAAWQHLVPEARELFDDKVVRYLDSTLWPLLVELTELQEQALWESVSNKLGTGARGAQAIAAHGERKKAILAQRDTIDRLFQPYLK
jgi:hypothetical protein